MFSLVGVLLNALGLFSGLALLLASFGVMNAGPGFTLWIAFPALCLIGFALFTMQARAALTRTLSLAVSGGLLLLGVVSGGALVLGSAGVIQPPATTGPLWFVLVISFIFGTLGAASFKRSGDA